MLRIFGVVFLLLLGMETAEARKQIVVDLSKQEAYAYEDGQLKFSGWISTGRPGRRTPTGHYRVLEKDIDHVSSKYPEPNGGAEMHYMLRLTDYGIAMHLGYVPNYPASHGCIRLENGFAQKMYYWANVGTPVLIKGYPPRRIDRPISRNTIGVATRNRSSSPRSIGNYSGNDPLKFLSTVPGKRESVQARTSQNHKKNQKKKKITENENKPMTPLGMLRSNG